MDSGKAILMLPALVGIVPGSPVPQALINPLNQTPASWIKNIILQVQQVTHGRKARITVSEVFPSLPNP